MSHKFDEEDKQQLQELFAKYAGQGYTHIRMEYNGSGDSGDVDGVYVTKDMDDSRDDVGLDQNERGPVEDIFDTIIEEAGYEGYENNDGGQGNVFIDLKTFEVTIKHEWNITDVEYDTAHLKLF